MIGFIIKQIQLRETPPASEPNALWWQRFVFLDRWPNKIEHEPTKYRSRRYGNGYVIPVSHRIERIFSHPSCQTRCPASIPAHVGLLLEMTNSNRACIQNGLSVRDFFGRELLFCGRPFMSFCLRRLGSPVSSLALSDKGGGVQSPTRRSNATLLHVLTAGLALNGHCDTLAPFSG
jgi:hypothetical protein